MTLTVAGAGSTSAQEVPASLTPVALAARATAHGVVHPDKRIAVQVPASAKYIGGERFTLYNNADAEIHVFAEADARHRVKRLYWIQFENFLPSKPELRYNYADNRRARLWGTVTWTGGGPRLPNQPDRPGSDREHVMNILAHAGYTTPPEMMSARLIQLLDDPNGTGRGRHELMLIYSEDLAPTGKRYAELVQDGRTTLEWEPLEEPLIARATTAFSVERLKR